MPGPVFQDFTLYRGNDQILDFYVIDDNGVAVDILNWTTQLTLRKHDSDADPVVLAKTGAINGPSSNGVVRVSLTKAETLALQARKYAYSLCRTNLGSADDLAQGVITVQLNVLDAA